MSINFDPSAYSRDLEQAATAGNWTIHYLTPMAAGPRPWLHRGASSGSKAPHVYLSSGIHGDEISGPYALLRVLHQPDFFAGFEVTIFPILNPNGLVRGTRFNADQIDLNRDYRNSRSQEIQGHIAALQTLGRFDAALMLHEDIDGIGAYLYELNQVLSPTLGAEMVTAMGCHVPIDHRPEIEEAPAHGGVISRKDLIQKLGKLEDRPDWPEAIYLALHHTEVSFTTETPVPFPLEQRIQAQIAAIATVLRALR
jgi:murein peptide amidase A